MASGQQKTALNIVMVCRPPLSFAVVLPSNLTYVPGSHDVRGGRQTRCVSDLLRCTRNGAYMIFTDTVPGARVSDLKDVSAILDVFQKHGHSEVRTQHAQTLFSTTKSSTAPTFHRSTPPSCTPKGQARSTWVRSAGRNAAWSWTPSSIRTRCVLLTSAPSWSLSSARNGAFDLVQDTVLTQVSLGLTSGFHFSLT